MIHRLCLSIPLQTDMCKALILGQFSKLQKTTQPENITIYLTCWFSIFKIKSSVLCGLVCNFSPTPSMCTHARLIYFYSYLFPHLDVFAVYSMSSNADLRQQDKCYCCLKNCLKKKNKTYWQLNSSLFNRDNLYKIWGTTNHNAFRCVSFLSEFAIKATWSQLHKQHARRKQEKYQPTP